MRPECRTRQGSLPCSPWQSVCHDWTAADATHNCMPGCESILAFTAGWLTSVCGFCLCGIRSWTSHVCWILGMNELLGLLQRYWVGKAEPIPWPGRSCEFTLLDSVFFEIMSQNTFIFDHLEFSWWKDTLKLNMFWDLLSSGDFPFQCSGITNWSHLQGSRCPRRTVLIADSMHILDVC